MWQETKTIFLASLADVLHSAARILPSVFAMLLFLLLATAAAFLLRWLVLRVCERLGLDQLLREWGVSAPRATGRTPPSRLLARAAFWVVFLAGTFFALSIVDAPAMAGLSLQLVGYMPRAVVALMVFGVGIAGARFVERSVLIGAVNAGMQSAGLAALASRWLIIIFATAVSLDQAGVGSDVVTVAFGALFGGIVLALSLALGLGARDLVARSLDRRFPGEATQPDHRDATSASEANRIQHL